MGIIAPRGPHEAYPQDMTWCFSNIKPRRHDWISETFQTGCFSHAVYEKQNLNRSHGSRRPFFGFRYNSVVAHKRRRNSMNMPFRCLLCTIFALIGLRARHGFFPLLPYRCAPPAWLRGRHWSSWTVQIILMILVMKTSAQIWFLCDGQCFWQVCVCYELKPVWWNSTRFWSGSNQNQFRDDPILFVSSPLVFASLDFSTLLYSSLLFSFFEPLFPHPLTLLHSLVLWPGPYVDEWLQISKVRVWLWSGQKLLEENHIMAEIWPRPETFWNPTR